MLWVVRKLRFQLWNFLITDVGNKYFFGGQFGISIKMGNAYQKDSEKSPSTYADPNGDIPGR
jgi:hypothetical protein